AAQNGGALDDARVVFDVDGGGGAVGEADEVALAADGVEVAVALELCREGYRVAGLAAAVELEDGLVDEAVGFPVEVVGTEERRDFDDRVAVEEERTQHRLLGGDVVGYGPLDLLQHGHSHWSLPRMSVAGPLRG